MTRQRHVIGIHQPARIRCATAAHLLQIAFPARSAQASGRRQAQGAGRERARPEVDRLPLGNEQVAPHDRRAGLVVDIDLSA